MSTIPWGQRRGEKRPLSVWRGSLILTRFQTVRCFSQIYFPENMFKFGNSHLYIIYPEVYFFPVWRSSPVMGNPPTHWKPIMNVAREVICKNEVKHINVYYCNISAPIFRFSHCTNHIQLYRNHLIIIFTLLHFFLEKKFKSYI